QLSIYIHPEYFVGTSSMSHMRDLLEITKNDEYLKILKHEEHYRSIWVLLVDGGPDENPKHLKNIIEYCQLFCELDLDYLSLAGIELPVDKFGSHLNSQGAVIDEDLVRCNFEFADPFQNNGKEIPSWLWIEHHTQICHYSLNNNRFLLPLTKGKDNHYLNPIHILQYMNKIKLPKYDKICSLISSEMHQRFCCNMYNKYFPTLKMISNYKKINHSKKKYKQHNLDLSIKSANDTLSSSLIFSSRSMEPYLSTEEIIASLDYLDTQQIELSNAAFLEDFSNLSSIGHSYKSEFSSYLLEGLSDI
ncbi:42464_t:CDS:2, partial [Gigaspora margarita]